MQSEYNDFLLVHYTMDSNQLLYSETADITKEKKIFLSVKEAQKFCIFFSASHKWRLKEVES